MICKWSNFCLRNCLGAANYSSNQIKEVTSTPTDLSNVPTVYHDLATVFNKHKALSLPPHRSYDCSIEVLPSAPLQSSRLCNLSTNEKQAMQDYLDESLRSPFALLHLP